jgi:uncharacterized protein
MHKILVEKASPEKLKALGVARWSPWSCGRTEFDWEYEESERAYIQSGRVQVHTPDETVEIKADDLVFFPKGLKCTWKVMEPIRKVYRFE